MSQIKHTILESWPAIKEDLRNFASDTDAWIISALKKAYDAGNWTEVQKLIEVMEMVHNMSHNH